MIALSASKDATSADTSSDLREFPRPWPPLGGRRAVLVLAACAAAALPLSACSSGKSPTQVANAKTCDQVSAVLAEGPDPSDDPVGYPEAQILPLRQLHTSDSVLRSAISQLASAYDEFFANNGKSADATSAVATATARLNKLCPGAAA
jgi:hypothetical protein